LLAAVSAKPLVVTGFCGWKTTDAWIVRRIDRWRSLAGRAEDTFGLERLIALCSSVPMPAINVGVFGFGRGQGVLEAWRRLTEFGRETLLPDEIALQLLLPRFPHTVLSTRFNCSPAYAPHAPDVRIWHFVAQTHLGHPESRHLWLPIYRQCVEERVADIHRWSRVDRTDQPLQPMIAPIPQSSSSS
jgi:hypothetical protein